MQMCPDCDRVYDESEYTSCPYCSGELDEDMSGTKTILLLCPKQKLQKRDIFI